MTTIEFRCFGLLQVDIQGQPVPELNASPAMRRLLGYLIINRGRPLNRSQVAGIFWPDVPETQARRALNNLLWRLRRLAGGALAANLEAKGNTLCWRLPAGAWLDLEAFETLTRPVRQLEQAIRPPDASILAALEQAVLLYRGDLLAECDAEWSAGPRRRYQEQFTQTLQALATGYERAGAPDRALRYATELLRAEPYHEPGYEAMVRLHLVANQPQAALAVYGQYAQLWRDELGLSPSAGMQRLLHTAEQAAGNQAAPEAAARALAQLWQMMAQPDLPDPVGAAARQAIDQLQQTVANEATRLGDAAEAEYAWEAAQQAYQAALTALETLPANNGRYRRQYKLRLRCDSLYDRLAQRREQAENLARALNLARELADTAAQSEVRARQCWTAMEQCRPAQAIAFAEKALRLAGQNQPLQAQALRLLGSSHELAGHYQKAVTYHQQALALDAGAPALERLDQINLASVYTYLGEDWPALQNVQAALERMPERPPSLVRAIALGNLANIERELGLYGQASGRLQTAQQIAGALGDRGVMTWLAARAAVLYRQTGNWARAETWAAQAWRSSQEIHHPRFAIEAALELAHLHDGSNNSGAARAWLEQARELIGESGLTRYQAAAAILAALFHLEDGRVVEAAATAGDALAAVEATGEHRYLPLVHALLGVIAQRQADEETARRQFALAWQALNQRARAIPDPATQTAFLQATPLRCQLAANRPLTYQEMRRCLAPAADGWL